MRHKRYKSENRGRYLILLVLAAIIITCFAYPYFYSTLLRMEFNPNKLIRVSDFKGHHEAQQEFAVLSGKLVSMQGTTIKLQNGDGSTVWQKEISIREPFIAALKDIIVAVDMEKGKLYGIDGQGKTLWEAATKGRPIRIGTDKEYIWVRTKYREQSIVEVLNRKGENIAYLQVGKVQAIGVSVSPDGSNIAVTTAGVKDNMIVGGIILYKRDGSIVWAKSYTDSLVMGVKITNEGFVLVLTEKMLVNLSIGGDIQWQKEINGYITKALFTDQGLTALTLSQDYTGAVSGRKGEKTVIYGKRGSSLEHVDHREGIIGLAEGQDYLGVYSARRLQMVSLNGKGVMDKEFGRDLVSVYLLENNFMAYISAGKIYFEPII